MIVNYASELDGVAQEVVTSVRGKLQAGKLTSAFQRAKELVRTRPLCAEHWLVLSEVLSHPKISGDGLVAVKRAAKIAPSSSRVMAQLAHCLMFAGEFSEALATVDKALQDNKPSAKTWDKLGNVLNGCGELERAHHCFSQAVKLAPDDPHFIFNLATLQRAMGKFDKARASFTRVIALRADDSAAYLARSSLTTVTHSNKSVDELEACLDTELSGTTTSSAAKIRLCFALAKELEDLSEFSRSFHYLQRGADERRKRMDYRVESDVEAMSQIQRAFSAQHFKNIETGYHCQEPIFILGLPRTGTTLVERIVSSHSDVYAAGELQNFSIELVKQVQQCCAGEALNRELLIAKSAELDFKTLGERYITSTRPRTGHSPRFIDKLPLNFLYAGLIHKAIPQAKIIHLTRSPMDACYAIYKTLFEQAYPFSYNLGDLASYYIAYRKLMAHWQTLLGENMLNISYEELVADQEAVSRGILQFCNLDWQPQCLSFQNNKAPTATASASQVREGLYSSSIGRWQHYEQELSPLKDQLLAADISLEPW